MKQALKLRESVPEIAIAWAQRNERTMHRTKTFPQFYTFDRDVPGMGKWTMVVTAECKSSIRKGIFAISAYQTFHVPYAKDKKNIRVPKKYTDKIQNRIPTAVEGYFSKIMKRFFS